MARFKAYVPCPRCRAKGKDSRGDNLATYQDGSAHCFACNLHQFPKHYVPKVKEQHVAANKSAIPFDFTREVPAAGWKWLLSYGLPYSYWKPYTGYSPATERLVLTYGSPPRLSVGRYLGDDGERKWKMWGDRHGYAEILGQASDGFNEVVVVEDIISAHKVAQVSPALPIFGSDIHPRAMMALRASRRPVALWLDEDQYHTLPKKINRLQTFLDVPVRFIRKRKDPKEYTVEEIKEIL